MKLVIALFALLLVKLRHLQTRCLTKLSLLIFDKSGMKPNDILDISFLNTLSPKLPNVHIADVAFT